MYTFPQSQYGIKYVTPTLFSGGILGLTWLSRLRSVDLDMRVVWTSMFRQRLVIFSLVPFTEGKTKVFFFSFYYVFTVTVAESMETEFEAECKETELKIEVYEVYDDWIEIEVEGA